ncbi:MAG: hypothetical protein QGH26_04925 [Candidatus Pacebacteria bacterium]|jgi:hypothetical protein|nr:hypothetical protein [Candidatus Paceibacterota bacterium]
MKNRNIIRSEFESKNRFRIYNACKHYHHSAATSFLQFHHKFRLDDLNVGLCTLVGASQHLNKEESYGTNP